MKQINLLVIDDDDIVGFVVNRVCKLSKYNVNVTFCTTVEGAKAIYQDAHFDAVLVDLNIPVDDGWVFIEWFEENEFTSSLYILSSSTYSIDIERSEKHYSVVNYIEKPFEPRALDDIINDIESSSKENVVIESDSQ